MHNGASAKGMPWLPEGFKWVPVKTGTIMRPSACIFLPLLWDALLIGMLNQLKPRYGGIITQSWLTLSILECCSRKDVTTFIEFWTVPRWTVWTILDTIRVVREMHFILEMMPSEVRTASSSRFCLASPFAILSARVVSIKFCKNSR